MERGKSKDKHTEDGGKARGLTDDTVELPKSASPEIYHRNIYYDKKESITEIQQNALQLN